MLTSTTSTKSFTLSRPGNSVVTMQMPEPGAEVPKTLFTLPAGSTWTPSPHWHERYREFIQVQQGRARIVVDGVVKIVIPEDGVQTIERFAIHEFMRADVGAAPGDEDSGDVVIIEWTEPGDGLKEVFFRNIVSTLQQPAAFGSLHVLQILLVCAYCDNFDVTVSGPLAWAATHAVFALVRPLGGLLRLKPWYREYTPERLWAIAEAGGNGGLEKKTA